MNMQSGQILWASIGVLIGAFFLATWRPVKQFIRGRSKGFEVKKRVKAHETKMAKLVSTLFALLAISVSSWSFSYYAKQESLGQLWIEIATAIFGISTAGLLGGIVFEVFLRNEIFEEVSDTLVNIVTIDKDVVKELFTREKRNEVIRTMLQVNMGNDSYGDALYSDFLKKYISTSRRDYREFRYVFSDDITISNIDLEHAVLQDNYYVVVDRLSYRAELRPTDFVAGCGHSEEQLYALFSDPACLYRWLLKGDDFNALIDSGFGFSASLRIDGVECETLHGKGEITNRGYEVYFKNPFIGVSAPAESRSKVGQLVTFHLEIHTLHPRDEKFISVHLAYPVKGAQISFDYHDTDIRNVTKMHFLTGGENTPVIDTGIDPILAPRRHKLTLEIGDDHWIFPDSGAIFIW